MVSEKIHNMNSAMFSLLLIYFFNIILKKITITKPLIKINPFKLLLLIIEYKIILKQLKKVLKI